MTEDHSTIIKAFLKRYDELTPAIAGVFQIAAIHGFPWPENQTWEHEIQALRSAVSEETHG